MSTGLSRISQPSTFCALLTRHRPRPRHPRPRFVVLRARSRATAGSCSSFSIRLASSKVSSARKRMVGVNCSFTARAELAAEIAAGAVQRLDQSSPVSVPPSGSDEGGGVAQIGADAHLGHGDDLAVRGRDRPGDRARRISDSAWRISSPTRNCRCPAGADDFFLRAMVSVRSNGQRRPRSGPPLHYRIAKRRRYASARATSSTSKHSMRSPFSMFS